MSDDYLWDRKGAPDPDVEELERALSPLRYKERPFEVERAPEAKVVPLRPRSTPFARWMLLAAALLGGVLVWRGTRAPLPPVASKLPPVPVVAKTPPAATAAFPVERLDGAPRVGDAPMAASARLGVGEWLVTDETARARIAVADIGTVDVGTRSRVRLTATGPSQHRLDLAQGAISAKVDAPPRLFVVGTPAATAVDLGCAYTMEVDEKGNGTLRVTSGWVSLEDGGRASFVKAGCACQTRRGKGPGTPWFEDASPALREALSRFDFEDGGAAAVEAALRSARKRDALSVWHLVARVDGALRRKVVDRLQALSPRPINVDESAVVAADEAALERWRDAITW